MVRDCGFVILRTSALQISRASPVMFVTHPNMQTQASHTSQVGSQAHMQIQALEASLPCCALRTCSSTPTIVCNRPLMYSGKRPRLDAVPACWLWMCLNKARASGFPCSSRSSSEPPFSMNPLRLPSSSTSSSAPSPPPGSPSTLFGRTPLLKPCRPSLRAASSRAAVLCRMEVMSRPGFLSRRGLSNWLRVAPVTACCRLGPQRLGPVWSPVVARRSLEVDGFEASISRRPPSRDVRRSCECISRSSSSCRLPVSGEE
mmetsp:Transcript_37260/g.110011  ORF Transcript_37260/g.110011 Transcript_37260/m.110011 type:complete len:259 (-) Transcript_37260:242-1018(-)